MRKLSGKITCSTNEPIPPDSTLFMNIYDCSHAINCCTSEPAKELVEFELNDVSSFPIEYSIEYEDKNPVDMKHIWYSLVVRINDSKGLVFSNEAGTPIVKNQYSATGQIKENLDVDLVYYKQRDEDNE
jgi:uncharacterized lipoprotein YbaY